MCREVVLSLSGPYKTDMERPDSTYMPQLIQEFEPTTDSRGIRGIPDFGVDTWFMTQPDFYENRHFPSLNLMTDGGEVTCLLFHEPVTQYIGAVELSMDDLSRLSSARKAHLEWFHKEGMNAPRIDPPVD